MYNHDSDPSEGHVELTASSIIMILTLEKDVLVDRLVQKLDFDPPGGLF